MLKLRFPEDKISSFAADYSYRSGPEPILNAVQEVREQGWMSKDILQLVCEWKSPRSAGYMQSNSETFVEAVTRLTFSTTDERARIESLTLLDGVGWPTASVVLHFFHPERYPILDRRALWSLGVDQSKEYERFERWHEYVQCCRDLATKSGLSMRELDKALWQHSKEEE